ncbi:DEAD/DEAH box helicase, DDL60 and DDL60L-like protein, implicated in mRNA degradation [Schizosaccharomyces osmophilus]|uniref:DEAD/DEAH box helicase, DDL60 and DDL60L-like protein, implicated in mRNA degradation n=1 Tax=Schizosaccharomyces osmophilus TaxID=2545709 RepID=A0AAF0AY44_9SCHI|nr:DEAD/DEAH box helicase, DDL60 and DDL60L-like protein, implicated in mRNA degradation [Schizosaccharomyces osmophilus]WBW74660.1 DEAD/DEAH box helicase, DDL60 and DDL60L-like protein, implicated in mRNA degradation [Schizosaccharomyces osmophilus]
MSEEITRLTTVQNYRSVDLIGDFAGEELFLIDGDSLIFHILAQDCQFLSKNGVQILYAIYLLERELARFKSARLNFCIVFFKNWEALYSNYDDLLRSSLLLFRRVAIRHLRKYVPVFQFKTLADSQWSVFIAKYRPYGFMVLDNNKNIKEGGLPISDEQLMVFKSFIFFALSDGVPVALLGSYEFVDNKILCSILPSFFTRSSEAIEEASKVISDYLEKFGKNRQAIDLPEVDIDACSTNAMRVQTLAASWLIKNESSSPLSRDLAKVVVILAAVLEHLKISSRSQPSFPLYEEPAIQQFISSYLGCASSILNLLDSKVDGFHDLFDARLFVRLVIDVVHGEFYIPDVCREYALSNWKLVTDAVPEAGDLYDFSSFSSISKELCTPIETSTSDIDTSLAPYGDPVISPFYNNEEWAVQPKEVQPLETALDFSKLRINDKSATSKRYDDINATKKTGDSNKDKRQVDRMRRQDQFFISHIQKYAGSLTGAKGGQLKRQTIFTQTAKEAKVQNEEAPKNKAKAKDKEIASKKGKPVKLSKAEQIRAEIAAKKSEKEDNRNDYMWQETRNELGRIKDLNLRSNRLSQLLNTRTYDPYIENEMRLYRIRVLLSLWAAACVTDESKEKNVRIAVDIFREISIVYPKPITKQVKAALDDTLTALGFESVIRKAKKLESRPMSFPFVLPDLEEEEFDLEVPYTSPTFQLLHFGEYMERSMGSAPDNRVAFDPDEWQRQTLDILDKDESVFVVAPTSSGKTFISFYAMEKVLRDNDDGVVIYVAPTKALVNQLSAEVYARFNKHYPHAGQTVWSVYTRDYRINNPTNCQVLITVPHVLQSMLLQPALANAWCPKIKRIIFDEIHCIGQMEDGMVEEQLLLLAPCPIVALSATVGNPEEFHTWLSALQRAHANPIHLIVHEHRYSDLRKFVYGGAKEFKGLHDEENNGQIALIHPAAAMSFSEGTTTNLAFEPRDLLQLYYAMKLVSKGDFKISKRLDPDRYFEDIPFIKKVDVVGYEKKIKATIDTWASLPNAFAPTSPLQALIKHFCTDPQRVVNSQLQLHTSAYSLDAIASNLLPMLKDLNKQELLPVLCFNYDRQECEYLAENVFKGLVEKEGEWRENSEEWKEKMREFKKWQAAAGQRAKQMEKFEKTATEKQKEQALKESGDTAWIEFFDPEEPSPEFSFAGAKSTYGKEELYRDVESLRRRQVVPEWLVDALYRGIGVHHSGLNRRYRQMVEVLFRCGQLSVVIATRTLSLGINMPCRTVVFLGDNLQLNALNFHQAAGRAGRRGFDLLGHVGFLGVPLHKVYRLLTTKLWDIQGQFPLTTSLVLQLSQLISGSQAAPFARNTIRSILDEPKLMQNGDVLSNQVNHHLRFVIEYLLREGLLDDYGKPINLSNLTMHLYYAEPSNYAFTNLLRAGVFHKIADNYATDKLGALRETITILCHLFGRIRINEQYALSLNRDEFAPSEIILPSLPQNIVEVLNAHDERVLNLYKTYAYYYREHGNVGVEDDKLPLSNLKFNGTAELSKTAPTGVVSEFCGLAGLNDNAAKNVSDFMEQAPDGVFLKTSRLPVFEVNKGPLNAYLLDFFTHGSVELLVEQNGLKQSEVWFVLNDFSLALATICSCIGNLLNLVTDEDIENAMSALEGSNAVQASTEGESNTDWMQSMNGNYSTSLSSPELQDKMDMNLFKVYCMFLEVRDQFDAKFRKMWA